MIYKTASMGPRHLSRGILLGGPFSYSRSRRFNGATASEPWNLRVATHTWLSGPMLQWGHGI
mgnify:CR=1 FL=1